MKKLSIAFITYTIILGIAIGAIAALFLALIQISIDFIWTELPDQIHAPIYYPLIIGLIGGVAVGAIQTKLGPFPYTMHENMAEMRKTGRIEYKNRLLYTILAAWVILSFGASLGPEAALIGIVGGITTWVIDHMKLTVQRKEEMISLGVGAILSVIFLAPFNGLAENLDEDMNRKKMPKWSKLVLSILISVTALATFIYIKGVLPIPKSVFAIRLPDTDWSWLDAAFYIPALIVGLLFGMYFLFVQKIITKLLKPISNKWILALIGGASIGVFGMFSHFFLFSGEHQLVELTSNIDDYSVLFLLALGMLKPVLVGLCMQSGWKGGMIFPALFTSCAMGYVATWWLDSPVAFLITIFAAASCTKIVGSPLLTSSILLFIFPLQFFPFILITAFLVSRQWFKKTATTA
ncbi:chloride channel protein [Listeria booriae]|uniref:Chloride channel protein n=1 Tax=Listeria booriae TaxID=1552123 RepID=A0A7X0XQG2_9LIST|nr:chloride channel protein [Listeria booriae]MBC1778803.1 chloride channel protein [Listeria booriae]MBC1889386.1 chloride channel protein [Listeria booriae]